MALQSRPAHTALPWSYTAMGRPGDAEGMALMGGRARSHPGMAMAKDHSIKQDRLVAMGTQ